MRFLENIGPLRAVFIASILLSILAIWGEISPNNDGMLYVEAAQLFQQGGLDAARQVYDWLFFPVLIATLSSLTGLLPEAAAYTLATLLQAALGVVLVACTRKLYPQATWAAVVVVLALPALNNYRDFIIREHGAWLFTFVSLWLLFLWNERRTWWIAVASQASVLVAFLFRPECLIFLGVPFLWIMLRWREPGMLRSALHFVAAPLVAMLVLASSTFVWEAEVEVANKISSQLQVLNIAKQAERFDATAQRVGLELSPHVMGEDANRLLFVGLLSLIVIKFVSNFGVFVVPAWRAWLTDRHARGSSTNIQALIWAAALYFCVLAAMILSKYFMQARFVAFLNLLAVPMVAWGLWRVWHLWPRWRWLVVALVFVTAGDNVISTSPKKNRYPDAAAWVTAQSIDSNRIYFESAVVSYLAGMGYWSHPSHAVSSRHMLAQALEENRFDLILLSGRPDDVKLMTWAREHELSRVAVFTDERNRAVYAFVPNAVELLNE